ncbi:MAG: PIN domain-containing protein [Acidobacteria bacterium]|nr:PIN domain-containing protein [Acidobacteriota bacterium]
MTLIDTGPIVALVDKADRKAHKKCTAVFRSLKSPPLTTWPCLAEVFYLAGQIRGWVGQRTVLGFLTKGAIRVHTPIDNELGRISELMTQYKDTPMSFADASLVSLAEVKGIKTIFTLDSDFDVYRINGKNPFDVIPLDSR